MVCFDLSFRVKLVPQLCNILFLHKFVYFLLIDHVLENIVGRFLALCLQPIHLLLIGCGIIFIPASRTSLDALAGLRVQNRILFVNQLGVGSIFHQYALGFPILLHLHLLPQLLLVHLAQLVKGEYLFVLQYDGFQIGLCALLVMVRGFRLASSSSGHLVNLIAVR